MPLLVEACPDVQPTWEAHLADWKDEAPGIYTDFSAFVGYLLTAYEKGDKRSLEAAFESLERFLVDGDPEVRECTFIGFIGKLRRRASWKPYRAAAFVPFLRPQSQKAWIENERIWEGMSSLAAVIRAEREKPE